MFPAWLRLFAILALALGSVHSRAVFHEHELAAHGHAALEIGDSDDDAGVEPLVIASDHHAPPGLFAEPDTVGRTGLVRPGFRLAANEPAPPTWRSPPLTEPPSA